MKPFYVTVLSPMQVTIGFVALCAVLTMVLWVLPAIRRDVDRKGGRCLIQLRAVASFGSAFFRAGGGFYRFALYDKYMIVCLFRATTFKYDEIAIDRKTDKSRGRLRISIAGVRVSILGDEDRIEEFARLLSEQIATSKKR